MHEWTLEPGAYDLRAHAGALVDTFIAGLVARPPTRRAAAAAKSRRFRRATDSRWKR